MYIINVLFKTSRKNNLTFHRFAHFANYFSWKSLRCNTYLDESLIFSFNNLRMNEWNLTEMLKAQSRFS
jgi:hypothetical protein